MKITTEKLQKMRSCSALLPDPGPSVVKELLNHIDEIENDYKLLSSELQNFPNLTAMRECMIEAADENIVLKKALKQSIDIISKYQNLEDIPKYNIELCDYLLKFN